MPSTLTDTALPDRPPRLLTADEAAAQWRVTRRSVYRWIATGQLDHIRVAGAVRIPEGALPARNTAA